MKEAQSTPFSNFTERHTIASPLLRLSNGLRGETGFSTASVVFHFWLVLSFSGFKSGGREKLIVLVCYFIFKPKGLIVYSGD